MNETPTVPGTVASAFPQDLTLVATPPAPSGAAAMVKIHEAAKLPIELLWTGHVLGSSFILVAVALILALRLPVPAENGAAAKES